MTNPLLTAVETPFLQSEDPIPDIPRIAAKPVTLDHSPIKEIQTNPVDLADATADSASSIIKLRKINKSEHVRFHPDHSQFVQVMLLEAETSQLERRSGLYETYYYVADQMTEALAPFLKPFCIVPFYSFTRREFGICPMKIISGNGSWESRRRLLASLKGRNDYSVRMVWSMFHKVYESSITESSAKVEWVDRLTTDLLTEALADYIIENEGHPIAQHYLNPGAQ